NTEWVLTLGSATALAQRGIGKTGPNALHQGDKITVKFLPAKDGSPLGFLKTVIMPDGRVIQISAGNPNDLTRRGSSWDFLRLRASTPASRCRACATRRQVSR